jgi:hypothetical protein
MMGKRSSAEFVEKFNIPRSESAGQVLEAVTRQISHEQCTPEDRDNQLSTPNEGHIGREQIFDRPKFQDAVARWVMALRCYSVALKNVELIKGEDKRHHMRRLLRSWAKLVAFGIEVIGALANRGQVKIAGLKLTSTMPNGENILNDVDMLRIVYLLVPMTVSKYMGKDLGSAKLANIITNYELSGRRLLPEFLQNTLGLELKLPSALSDLEEFADKIGSNAYLSEAMIWLLRDIYLERQLTKEEWGRMANIAARLLVQVRGVHGSEKGRQYTSFINELQKQRHISSLRKSDAG